MARDERRAKQGVVLAVWLAEDRQTVEVADGELVGHGFAPYLDEARTIPLVEDGRSPVLPGVFCARVAGVPFHDDVVQLPHSRPDVGSRSEPSRPTPRTATPWPSTAAGSGSVTSPPRWPESLAPAGTRVGRGIIVMEWSSNGVRQGITVLGSMQVTLQILPES